MTNLTRARVLWTGFIGAPGYSTFYCAGAEDPTVASSFLNSVQALFNGIKTYIPSDVTLTFPGDLAVIDDATSQQVSGVAVTAPANVVGTSVASYSAATGIGMDWLTGVFSGGRLVRGRTFIVPAGSNAYGTDGQVAAGCKTAVNSAIDTYLAANDGALRLIQRVTAARPVGTSAQISSGMTAPKVFVLRSRRD